MTAKTSKDRPAKREFAQAICDAVWNGEINQVWTEKVAERFGCSPATARRILHSIVNGTSGDPRFVADELGEGVLIQDGSTFTLSYEAVKNRGYTPCTSSRQPKHICWFLT